MAPTGCPLRLLLQPAHLLDTSYSWASTAQGTPATLTVSCTSSTCWPRLEPLMVTRVPPSTGPVSGSTCSTTGTGHLHVPGDPWQPGERAPASPTFPPPEPTAAPPPRRDAPVFQLTEWMTGAGHWVTTASALPQASRAMHWGRSPLHHTQPYWGRAVWQRLQSSWPTAQS